MHSASKKCFCAILAVGMVITSLSACSKQEAQPLQENLPQAEEGTLHISGTLDETEEFGTASTQSNEAQKPQESTPQKPTKPQEPTKPQKPTTPQEPSVQTPSVLENEKLEKLIRKKLQTIVKPNMSKREQAYAVYKYTNSSIKFTGDSKKGDWQKAAYDGLVQGRGDCYTYYAVSRAFLTVLGIPNIEVRRAGPTAQNDPHWWNLVNCGDGWYHFDACPHSKKFPFESFMFTDAQAEAYSIKRGNHYYDFDKNAYPPRETK